MVPNFYHVTHEDNLKSILVLGLLPEKAQSDTKRVWFVTDEALPWAVAHAALRWRALDVPRLAVLSVQMRSGQRYYSWGPIIGVFWTGLDICPRNIAQLSEVTIRMLLRRPVYDELSAVVRFAHMVDRPATERTQEDYREEQEQQEEEASYRRYMKGEG